MVWVSLSQLVGPFYISDYCFFTGFCIILWLLFLLAALDSTKRKAWIVTCASSFVLTIFGSIQTWDIQVNNLWTNEYFYSEDNICRCVVIFFVASNFMDMILGYAYYPEHVDPFTTIAHHIFYVIFMYFILTLEFSRGFNICFFMEAPTFLRAVGSIWPQYRYDLFFGVVFFLARIAFNVYLSYQLYFLAYPSIMWTSLAVLGLHIYWFTKWLFGFINKRSRTLKSQ